MGWVKIQYTLYQRHWVLLVANKSLMQMQLCLRFQGYNQHNIWISEQIFFVFELLSGLDPPSLSHQAKYTFSGELDNKQKITFPSSYTMLFVGPNAVCFVKKRKKEVLFLLVDFLCCSFCINVLLLNACGNLLELWLVCDSHETSRLSRRNVSLCLKFLLFILGRQRFHWMTQNKYNDFTFPPHNHYWLAYILSWNKRFAFIYCMSMQLSNEKKDMELFGSEKTSRFKIYFHRPTINKNPEC